MKVVDGKPILYHVINQISSSKILKKIVIATSTNTDDDTIENHAKKLGISLNILDPEWLIFDIFPWTISFALTTVPPNAMVIA